MPPLLLLLLEVILLIAHEPSKTSEHPDPRQVLVDLEVQCSKHDPFPTAVPFMSFTALRKQKPRLDLSESESPKPSSSPSEVDREQPGALALSTVDVDVRVMRRNDFAVSSSVRTKAPTRWSPELL